MLEHCSPLLLCSICELIFKCVNVKNDLGVAVSDSDVQTGKILGAASHFLPLLTVAYTG